MSENHLNAHVDSTVCGKCRKELGPGHRVTLAYIIQTTGIDTATLRKGATMGAEYEVVHLDCNDPLLVKGLTDG
jgi:hypothetical protein